jgi:hypothetical protein
MMAAPRRLRLPMFDDILLVNVSTVQCSTTGLVPPRELIHLPDF